MQTDTVSNNIWLSNAEIQILFSNLAVKCRQTLSRNLSLSSYSPRNAAAEAAPMWKLWPLNTHLEAKKKLVDVSMLHQIPYAAFVSSCKADTVASTLPLACKNVCMKTSDIYHLAYSQIYLEFRDHHRSEHHHTSAYMSRCVSVMITWCLKQHAA